MRVENLAVVDTKEGKLVSLIETGGETPHPGRGANLNHPVLWPGLGYFTSR